MKHGSELISVVGNSLASVIFLQQLVDQRRGDIEWARTGSNHFEGFRFDDLWVDHGMFLLEPTVTEFDHPLESFNFDFRNGVNPFVHHFLTWLSELGYSLQQAQVLTRFRGEFVRDFFIGDALEILNLLPDRNLRKIRQEIAERLTRFSSHPSRKLTDPLYSRTTYRQRIEDVLGPEFYRMLIDPMLRKIHPDTGSSLLAVEHRVAWLPLHYPESVINWIDHSRYDFRLPEFMYPGGLTFAQLISRLVSTLLSSVTVRDSIETLTSSSSSTGVFFGNVSQLVHLISDGEFHKDSLSSRFDTRFSTGRVVYLQCKASSPPSTVFLPDIVDLAFRASMRDTGEDGVRIASFEYGANTAELGEEELVRDARNSINSLFNEDPIGSPLVRGVTYVNRVGGRDKAIHAAVLAHLLMRSSGILGVPIWEGNGSCNDQAVAGLATARKLTAIE